MAETLKRCVLPSYFSPSLRKLFRAAVEIPEDRVFLPEEIRTYIDFENGTFIIENLTLLLKDFLKDIVTKEDSQMLSGDKLKERKVEFYECILATLCPIFHMCHSYLIFKYKGEVNDGNVTKEEKLKSNGVFLNDELIQWLSDDKLVQDCMSEIKPGMNNLMTEKVLNTSQVFTHIAQTNSASANAISALLLLTPILERSLGNVLASALSATGQAASHKVPTLLRDLILNETLQHLIDSNAVVFVLHVLIGTPRSLNLRNIVWHGFASNGNEQFSSEWSIFVSTLLILTRTLGKRFRQKRIEGLLSRIQPRKQISLKRIVKIYGTFKADKIEEICDTCKKEIKSYDVKNSIMGGDLYEKKNILDKFLHSYETSNFWLSLCLILPEWECVARILFSVVNKCEERIQTAESEALYTTFDEILAPKLNNGDDNLFPKCIGLANMELLMDLLVLPEGPRLRDKMSHGEVCRNDKFIKMSVELVIASYLSLLSILQNVESSNSVEAHNEKTKCISLTDDYKSQYHATTLLLEDLKAALNGTEVLLPGNHDLWPTAINFEWENDSLMIFQKDQNFVKEINYLILKLSRHINHQECWKEKVSYNTVDISKLLLTFVLHNYPDGVNGNEKVCSSILYEIRASTLYRSKREYELWSILRKIVGSISSGAQKIIDNMKEKKHHHEKQTLRSRQRITYTRMLKTIPLIHLTFLFMFIIILNHLFDFYKNTIVDIDEDEFCRKLKKSKKYLKMCENLETYVDKGKNRWEESTEIVKYFIEIVTC